MACMPPHFEWDGKVDATGAGEVRARAPRGRSAAGGLVVEAISLTAWDS